MSVLFELNPMQKHVLDTVKEFAEREIRPIAREYEHKNQYPFEIVERMKELGLFGLTISDEYGGAGLDCVTYALIIEEITRVWMSISGIINSHLIMAYVVEHYGTEDQKKRFLPHFASGEKRGGLALTEANAGTDVQNIQTVARREGDRYIINGTKMFITNSMHGNTFALLAKTDKEARPAHKGMSMFIIEKGHPGFKVVRELDKLGYKGLDTCELVFEDFEVPADNLVGGVEGQGFYNVMSALELGRINVAARGVGIARACFEDSIRYAQQRVTFGKPICEHQAIQIKLADMATKLEAAKLLLLQAATMKDKGIRCDLEAGMAKLFATELCVEASLEAMRIHGGYGYIKEFDIERYYRDAPLMAIGEGTNEIQRSIISRGMVKKYKV